MDRRLVDVCQSSNVEALNALLEDDPSILDRIDQIPSTRTPLHLAVIVGKPDFAREMVRLKPSFMYKFDRYGYSPIHLAAEKGQAEIVKDLLKKDMGLAALVMGGEQKKKFTPLHCAVMSGNAEVVNLLLGFLPQCIWDLTAQKETPLHLAVKNGQVGSFLALINGMNPVEAETLVLKSMDDDGNTVFNLAVSSKQDQVIEALSRLISIPPQLDVLNQTQKKEDRTQKEQQNPRPIGKETDVKLSQISIKIPPTLAMKTSKQEVFVPEFNHIRSISHPKVVTLAVITGLACFFTAIFDPRTELVPAPPESGNSLLGPLGLNFLLMLSNVLGFLLSSGIIVAAVANSPHRKLLLLTLAAVSGAYAFTVVSKLPGAYRGIFGVIVLATGGSLSSGYIRNWLEDYQKKTGLTGKIDTPTI